MLYIVHSYVFFIENLVKRNYTKALLLIELQPPSPALSSVKAKFVEIFQKYLVLFYFFR